MSGQGGGVTIPGTVGTVAGDIVGGNKGLDEAKTVSVLLDALQARGVIATAQSGGLERRTIIMLAQRLKPEERRAWRRRWRPSAQRLRRTLAIAHRSIGRGTLATRAGRLSCGPTGLPMWRWRAPGWSKSKPL